MTYQPIKPDFLYTFTPVPTLRYYSGLNAGGYYRFPLLTEVQKATPTDRLAPPIPDVLYHSSAADKPRPPLTPVIFSVLQPFKARGVYRLNDFPDLKYIFAGDVGDKYDASELTFDHDGGAADNSLVEVPSTYIYPASEVRKFENDNKAATTNAGTTTTTDPTDVSIDPASVFNRNKPVVVADVSSFLDNITKNSIWDTSNIKSIPKVANEPGMVSRDLAIKIGQALKAHCDKVMGSSSTKTLEEYIMHVLQLAVTYYTSTDTEFKESDYIDTEDKKRIRPGDVWAIIRETAVNTGYENPVRQYFAYFTPTVIQATLNGKLTPNQRVMASHGTPKRFFAYCYDFIRPNYEMMSNSALLAHNLSKQQAVRNKSSAVDHTLHNLYDARSTA